MSIVDLVTFSVRLGAPRSTALLRPETYAHRQIRTSLGRRAMAWGHRSPGAAWYRVVFSATRLPSRSAARRAGYVACVKGVEACC
jgi:hypothetical protein